jgi:4-hydroxy-2-oxoheptanedioate aldolase
MLYPHLTNALLDRAKSGQVCLGIHTSSMSPALIELYGLAGLDFVVLGTEVEAMNPATLEHLLRAAAAAQTLAMVKVRRPEPNLVADALTFGAPMVIVPHITSAAQLREMITAARIPGGYRAECPAARYNGYGTMHINDSARLANEARSIVPIIEDKEALDHLDEIMAVEDFDVVEIGPFDLSRSLGDPRGYECPQVLDAIERVGELALARGKRLCLPAWITTAVAGDRRKQVQWQIDNLIARGVSMLYFIETIMIAHAVDAMMPVRAVKLRIEDATKPEAAEG